MRDAAANYILGLIHEIVAVDSTLILLAVLVVMCVMVLDSIASHARRVREAAGLSRRSSTISVDGARSLPLRNYVSDMQGLAGRPDALVIENGYLIPIERKPTSNKVRDRYVAQLLVYMRLIEEFEGKKPPYGYLILGANCRRIKIENSEERQAWLQSLIDEMNSILKGAAAKASPHPRKCSKCPVKEHCSFKALPAPRGASSSAAKRKAALPVL
ncbi:MAG: Dna2/Cas4 domain-containing protein [Deltaproteobacteria bacterium]|nr:Dna2/Cas4 domain-containing protein [Deltaproteobacteria bacterium]